MTVTPFTDAEQEVLSRDINVIRLLALWNHIQSGRVDSVKEYHRHEDRAGQLWDLEKQMVKQGKRAK